MDIDQLLAFERIVREGSFSRAARQLDISQPTISARIQNLEEELNAGKLVEVEVENLLPGYWESALVCLKRNMPLDKLLRDFVDEIDIQAKNTQAQSC